MRMIKRFRHQVLAEQDRVYDSNDGETPNHIILSKEVYDEMDEKNRFEQLKDDSNPKRPGYVGMKVWWSKSLDERETVALLISQEVFEQIVTHAEDFKC